MATQVTVITGEGSTTYSVSTGARGPAGPAGNATPAGTTGSVQINNAGALGADSGLVFTGTGVTGVLKVGGGSVIMSDATSSQNVAIGGGNPTLPLTARTTGNYNVSLGTGNLPSLTTGSSNVVMGTTVAPSLTEGYQNFGLGTNTLFNLLTGHNNIAIGQGAGSSVTTGSQNILIGNTAGSAVGTDSTQIVIAGTSDGPRSTVIGFDGRLSELPTQTTRFIGDTITFGSGVASVNNRTSLVQSASTSAKTITLPNVTGKLPVYTDTPAAGQVLIATDASGAATWGTLNAPDMLDRYFRYADNTEIAHGSIPEAGGAYRLAGSGKIFSVDTTTNVCALKTPLIAGTAQVETATAAGTVTADGNASVIVTSAGMAGSPLTILVAVTNTDTPTVWAGKVRTALNANATISALFTVGGTTTAISLTRLPQIVNGVSYFSSNDATLNIALANSTSTGITAAPTSTNTTLGVVTSNFGFVNGRRVKVNGTIPSPLVLNTLYYIVDATETTFKLALTSGGTAIDLTTTGTNPVITGLPFITGGALVAQPSSLYYLGNQTVENVRNITMELSWNSVTNLQAGVVGVAGLTIALAPTPIITDGSGIDLPAGMIHIQINRSGINFGIGTGGASFPSISPLNLNLEGGGNWNVFTQSFIGGKKIILRFEFNGDECRISAGGGSYVYKDPLIAAAAGKNWWIETTGDDGTVYTDFYKIYRLSVNSETLENQPSWSVQPKSQLLTDLTMNGPVTIPQSLTLSQGLTVAGGTDISGVLRRLPYAGFGAKQVIANLETKTSADLLSAAGAVYTAGSLLNMGGREPALGAVNVYELSGFFANTVDDRRIALNEVFSGDIFDSGVLVGATVANKMWTMRVTMQRTGSHAKRWVTEFTISGAATVIQTDTTTTTSATGIIFRTTSVALGDVQIYTYYSTTFMI